MNNTEREKIINTFWKWFDKHYDTYTNEEAKLREYYGIDKTGSNRLVAFYAGYRTAWKEKNRERKKAELHELSAEQLFDAGMDVASCVRFMDWIAKKDRDRFGDTSFGTALEAAVIAGESALEIAERAADDYARKAGRI
jgi:uncharacterized protein YjiS (DUF1127 family)